METLEKSPVKSKKQAQLFSNPYLEILTKTSPAITWTVYPLISSAFFIFSYQLAPELALLERLEWMVIGFLSWTLIEYLMHRFVFHFISESKFVQRFHYTMHGVHHEFPLDEQRVFMPPVPGLLISSVLFGVFSLVLGLYSAIFMAGLILGYLAYSTVHWAIHTYKAPKGFEKLWHHHLVHHYKEHDKAFGVTSTFWDRVFGTMPKS